MKNIINIILALLAFTACTKPAAEQTPMGDLTIRVDAGTAVAGETFSSLFVSLHNEDSTVVLVHEQLSVSLTDSGYVSESIHLPLGKYSLDGIVMQNHRGESVYFAPKNGSKAATISGKCMPETFKFSVSHTNIDIPAVSPRSMGIRPADCGYADFPNWNSPISPNNPQHELHCIRIGVGYGKILEKPLVFKVFADDSLVLTGTCSGGVTDFQVPSANLGYRIVAKDNGFETDQYYTANAIIPFSCSSPGARFIDLRLGIPKKPQIVFIRQEIEMGKPQVKLSLMDTEGNIYKVLSPVMLNDSAGKAVFIIDSATYRTYQSYMVTPISTSNQDSLFMFQMQFPVIESELNLHYIQNGMPAPVKIFAVQQLPDGRHRALLVDAGGAPKGTGWNSGVDFLPVRWLWNNNF